MVETRQYDTNDRLIETDKVATHSTPLQNKQKKSNAFSTNSTPQRSVSEVKKTNEEREPKYNWNKFARKSKSIFISSEKANAKKVNSIESLKHMTASQVQVKKQLMEDLPAKGNPDARIEPADNLKVYRKNLYKAFQLSMDGYAARFKKQGQEMEKLESVQSYTDPIENFASQRPRAQKFTNEPTKLIKFGEIFRGPTERWFVLDDTNILYMGHENSSDIRGTICLVGSQVKLEHKSKQTKKTLPWIDEKADYRVIIRAKERNGKPIFVYSNNLHDLKALVAKVKYASQPLFKTLLIQFTKYLNMVQKATLFQKFLTIMQIANFQKMKNSRVFSIFGDRLMKIALQNQQRNHNFLKKLVEFADSKTIKLVGTQGPKLKSTFRTGKIVEHAKLPFGINVNLFLYQRLVQLTHMIKSRRQFRSQNVYEQITDQIRHEISGFSCQNINIIHFDENGAVESEKELDDGAKRIYFESHSPNMMLIEKLQPDEMNNNEYFQQDFLQDIDLNQVSLIATNQENFMFQGKPKRDGLYTIKLFGLCQQVDDSDDGDIFNRATEFAGLAPLRMVPPRKLLQVKIDSVKFPLQFFERYNGKGFIKIRLIQGLGVDNTVQMQDPNWKMDANKSYHFLSRDIKFQVDESKIQKAKSNGFTKIDLRLKDLSFMIYPLVHPDFEQFTVEVLYYSSISPLPTVIKDYMIKTTFKARPGTLAEKDEQNPNIMTYEVQDEAIGMKLEVKLSLKSVGKVNSHSKVIEQVDEREGSRLLVGRYVVLDNKIQMQVISFNGDSTVNLRTLYDNSYTKIGIPLYRITQIERYGVSVYELDNLPTQIQKSSFTWTCTIKTSDQTLLTAILRKIQDAQILRTLKKRKTDSEVHDMIMRGRLLCSVVEATNLKFSKALDTNEKIVIQPYVKVSVEYIADDLSVVQLRKPQETHWVNIQNMNQKQKDNLKNEAKWVNPANPTGYILNLGNFIKDSREQSATAYANLARQNTMKMINPSNKWENRWQNEQVNNSEEEYDIDLNDNEEEDEYSIVMEEMREDPNNVFIRFQVYNPPNQDKLETVPKLIGQALLRAVKVIDLKELWQSQQLLLLLPDKDKKSTELLKKQDSNFKLEISDETLFSGILSIQTLFVPDNSTRFKFDLYENVIFSKVPEGLMHYGILNMPKLFDKFNYALPQSNYNAGDQTEETYFKNISDKHLPIIFREKQSVRRETLQELQEIWEQEQNYQDLNGPFIQKSTKFNKKCLQVFTSPQEIFDFLQWLNDQERPIRQPYVVNFSELWFAQTTLLKYEAKQKLYRFFWQKYINDLSQSKSQTSVTDNWKQNSENGTVAKLGASPNSAHPGVSSKRRFRFGSTYVSAQVEAIQRRTDRLLASNPSKALITEAEGQELAKDPETNKTSTAYLQLASRGAFENLFLHKDRWKEQNDQRYTDLYHLIYKGIPDEIRIQVWKNLLKVEVWEVEEQKKFREVYGENEWHKELTVYENYVKLSDKFDCLSFRQIDEDIAHYEIDKQYYQNEQNEQFRGLVLKHEIMAIRRLLKSLILWSDKSKRNAEESICLTYGTGLIDMIQRFITICLNENDCFQILTAIIRCFPRPFSVSNSILLGSCDSVMRYEIIAFKAMVQQNLPRIYRKLKDLSLPIELLVYQSIDSFYATTFISDIVLRLWDIIIFNFSIEDQRERKRALWWLLAPACLILQTKEEQILKASTHAEVMQIYKSGGAMTYDPDSFIDKLRKYITDIFVEGLEINQRGEIVKMIFRLPHQVQNQNAYDFEDQRAAYIDQIRDMFTVVQKENTIAQNFIEHANAVLSKQNQGFFDFQYLNKNLIVGIQELTQVQNQTDLLVINQPSLVQNLQMQVLKSRMTTIYEEVDERDCSNRQSSSLVKRRTSQMVFETGRESTFLRINDILNDDEDLQLSSIFVSLHKLSASPPGISNGYQVRLEYGKIDKKTMLMQAKSVMQTIMDDDVQNPFSHQSRYDSEMGGHILTSPQINMHSQFDYQVGNNHLRIEIIDQKSQKSVLEALLPLTEINHNRFVTQDILLRSKIKDAIIIEGDHQFIQLKLSFFIEKAQQDKQQFSDHVKTLQTILRKAPVKVDIFGKNMTYDFKEEFKKIVRLEFETLSKIIDRKTVLDIINETYNRVELDDYAKVSNDDFDSLIKTLFPLIYHQKLSRDLFQAFMFSTGDASEVIRLTQDEEKNKSIWGYFSGSQNPAQQSDDRNKDIEQKEFSLRNFLITLVLMSHTTVKEKLSILFDMFEKSSAQIEGGITQQTLFQIVQSVYQRIIYFIPDHELVNQLEWVFANQVGIVKEALWTSITDDELIESLVPKRDQLPRIDTLMGQGETVNFGDHDEKDTIINITGEVQHAFQAYFKVFGTKKIDFYSPASPFRTLSNLVGAQKSQQLLKFAKNTKEMFRVVLICQAGGRIFSQELKYNLQTGNLQVEQRQSIIGEEQDIRQFIKKNSLKLDMTGLKRPVSKEEFLSKIESMPLFTNLIRVETFFRDRKDSTIKEKQYSKPVVVTFRIESITFVLTFSEQNKGIREGQNINMQQRLVNIEMGPLHLEDTLIDVREKVCLALGLALQNKEVQAIISQDSDSIISNVIGTRVFHLLEFDESSHLVEPVWVQHLQDLMRISILQAKQPSFDQMTLQLKTPSMYKSLLQQEQRTHPSSYDCYSIFKHNADTREWLPCKIVKRRLKRKNAYSKQYSSYGIKFSLEQYEYWVEFLHLQNFDTVQRVQFKRDCRDILFSTRYTIDMQRSFKQQARNYIRQIYNKCYPDKQSPILNYYKERIMRKRPQINQIDNIQREQSSILLNATEIDRSKDNLEGELKIKPFQTAVVNSNIKIEINGYDDEDIDDEERKGEVSESFDFAQIPNGKRHLSEQKKYHTVNHLEARNVEQFKTTELNCEYALVTPGSNDSPENHENPSTYLKKSPTKIPSLKLNQLH